MPEKKSNDRKSTTRTSSDFLWREIGRLEDELDKKADASHVDNVKDIATEAKKIAIAADRKDHLCMYGDDIKIPFIDGIKCLIIPDDSTQLSALRTGKIDILNSVFWDQVDGLEKSNPELLKAARDPTSVYINMRQDKHPWNILKVRQAMCIAINQQELIDNLYEGMAETASWPFISGMMSSTAAAWR